MGLADTGDIYTELNENSKDNIDDYGDYPTPLKILIEASNGASDLETNLENRLLVGSHDLQLKEFRW